VPAIERCVEAISCGVRLEAVPAAEAVSNDRVMLLEQALVPVVAHLGLFLRRSHDVREQDGRQHSVELGRVRLDADELPDHIQHGGLLVDPQLIRTGEEADLGVTQERGQVFERLAVVLASQEEHGRGDRRHGTPNIRLVVDPSISAATSGVAVCRLSQPQGACSASGCVPVHTEYPYASVPQRSMVADVDCATRSSLAPKG